MRSSRHLAVLCRRPIKKHASKSFDVHFQERQRKSPTSRNRSLARFRPSASWIVLRQRKAKGLVENVHQRLRGPIQVFPHLQEEVGLDGDSCTLWKVHDVSNLSLLT